MCYWTVDYTALRTICQCQNCRNKLLDKVIVVSYVLPLKYMLHGEINTPFVERFNCLFLFVR